MIAIYVISAILLLFAAIAMLPATLTVKYNRELCAYASFLFKKHRLYPRDKKRAKKAENKKSSAKRKTQKKPQMQKSQKKPSEQKKPKTLLENIELIKELLGVFIPKTAKRVKIKASRIIVNVATGDAATTAMLFPAVNGAVLALLTYLDNQNKFVGLDRSTVAVHADFVSDKPSADIEISFSLRVWHIVEIIFATTLKYVTKK